MKDKIKSDNNLHLKKLKLCNQVIRIKSVTENRNENGYYPQILLEEVFV